MRLRKLLLALIALSAFHEAPAAISIAHNSIISTTTPSVTVTTGDLILYVSITSGTTPYITSMSGSTGESSWTSVFGTFGGATAVNTLQGLSYQAYYAVAAGSGTDTVTVAFHNGTPSTLEGYLIDISQAATSVQSNIYAALTNPATTTDAVTTSGGTGSATISTLPALIYAVVRASSNPSFAHGTNFTQLTASTTKLSEYYIDAATSPINATATMTGGTTPNVVIWQFAIAQASAGCTHNFWKSTGSFVQPDGATGNYWSSAGSFATPNCTSGSYWRADGNFLSN